jgi:hypothetical protein
MASHSSASVDCNGSTSATLAVEMHRPSTSSPSAAGALRPSRRRWEPWRSLCLPVPCRRRCHQHASPCLRWR